MAAEKWVARSLEVFAGSMLVHKSMSYPLVKTGQGLYQFERQTDNLSSTGSCTTILSLQEKSYRAVEISLQIKI